jgi:hypothetical protein
VTLFGVNLLPFIAFGLTAGALGMLGALICRQAIRKGRPAQAELKSMLREHEVECSGQIEQLRRKVAVLELQLPRPDVSPGYAVSRQSIGRREMQLIARISTLLRQ